MFSGFKINYYILFYITSKRLTPDVKMTCKKLKSLFFIPYLLPLKKKKGIFSVWGGILYQIKVFLWLILRKEKGLDIQNQSIIIYPGITMPRGMLGSGRFENAQ